VFFSAPPDHCCGAKQNKQGNHERNEEWWLTVNGGERRGGESSKVFVCLFVCIADQEDGRRGRGLKERKWRQPQSFLKPVSEDMRWGAVGGAPPASSAIKTTSGDTDETPRERERVGKQKERKRV
jgi:hypothetical protein